MVYFKKREFARYLRKNQTIAENIVWEVLRNRKFLGLKFRRQFVLYGFVFDFYCMEHNLAIEIDGKVHEKRKEYDAERDSIVKVKGVKILRLKNEEVKENLDLLYDKIKKAII